MRNLSTISCSAFGSNSTCKRLNVLKIERGTTPVVFIFPFGFFSDWFCASSCVLDWTISDSILGIILEYWVSIELDVFSEKSTISDWGEVSSKNCVLYLATIASINLSFSKITSDS